MKIWLDDERSSPEGWVWLTSVDFAILLLEQREDIEEISLDHDLGLINQLDGGTVLNYLERRFYELGVRPPLIHIHTQNPVAKIWMTKVANKLNAMREE